MNKRVEIHGTSRADMNGKRGVATDFHEDLWRYTVKLDSGEVFKFKPANVRAEGADKGADEGYRFEIGQAVEAKTGEAEPWLGGEVVALDYRQDDWPAGRTVPYQIKLSDGRLIFAPFDNERAVRARATEVKSKGKDAGKAKEKKGRAGRK